MDNTAYDREDDEHGELTIFFFGKPTVPEAQEFHQETHPSVDWKFSYRAQAAGYASGLTYEGNDAHPYQAALPCEPGEEHVYFVHAPEVHRVKIGFSADPAARISSMQTGSPCSLRLVKLIRGGKDLEQKIHVRFQHLRIDGEWFDDEILAEWARDPF